MIRIEVLKKGEIKVLSVTSEFIAVQRKKRRGGSTSDG